MRQYGPLLLLLTWPVAAWARLGFPASTKLYPEAPSQIASSAVAVAGGTVLIRQEVRAKPGARLIISTESSRVKVPAGAVLSAAESPEGPIFCTNKPYKNGNLLGREQVCFADRDNDGRFESLRSSGRLFQGSDMGSFEVGPLEPIGPVSYELLDGERVKSTIVIELTDLDRERRRATICIYAEPKPKICHQKQGIDLTSLPRNIEVAGAEVEFSGSSDQPRARMVKALPASGILQKVQLRYAIY